jgi:hypothetical protein
MNSKKVGFWPTARTAACQISPRHRGGPAGMGVHALDAPELVTAPGAPAVAWPARACRCIFHDEAIVKCTDVERWTCRARS